MARNTVPADAVITVAMLETETTCTVCNGSIVRKGDTWQEVVTHNGNLMLGGPFCMARSVNSYGPASHRPAAA